MKLTINGRTMIVSAEQFDRYNTRLVERALQDKRISRELAQERLIPAVAGNRTGSFVSEGSGYAPPTREIHSRGYWKLEQAVHKAVARDQAWRTHLAACGL